MTEIAANLKLLIKTWSRDSHGLFDYETSSIKTNQLLISSGCKLIRKKNDVRFVQENQEIEFEERELAKIFFEENKVRISNSLKFGMVPTENNINDLQNKIWYVIKHDDNSQESQSSILSSGMYEIKLNEIIKLGRVKYAVTEVKLGEDLQTVDNHFEKPVFHLISEHKKKEDYSQQEILCKICYSNTDDESNPMINLCKCTGSISSIHFNCLKKWMNIKLTTKENEKKTVVSYSMKSFNCEICMAPYPLRFKFENKEFDIIDLLRPQTRNYIVLESLNQLKEKNNYKSIQVITLKENERIIMGRGHDSDVRINDISVSRSHADLILIENKVYIKDLRSKFGTLVLAQRDIELKNKQINLQIGRSYIEFTFSKENPKLRRETNGTRFSLNSNINSSSLEDKFLAPIFKKDDLKSNRIENININLPAFDIECEKVNQISPTTENENRIPINRKTSAFGNFKNPIGNINIFSVTNTNSKASSTTNLELDENKNIISRNKITSIFNNQNNILKTLPNERINSETSINNANLKFNLNRNDSLDSIKNCSLFSKQNNNSFDDIQKTIIQNPLIENINKIDNNHLKINDSYNNNQVHKNQNNGSFGTGFFETSKQNNFNNRQTNLLSLDFNNFPLELINEIKKNNVEKTINNINNNNNPLFNSMSKNTNLDIDNHTNINYLNNFFNNEKSRIMNLDRNEILNINQIPNQINNNYCSIINEELVKSSNLSNLGYFDFSTYEMKINLLNTLNSFSNNLNTYNCIKDNSHMNNQIGQNFLINNLDNQYIKQNYIHDHQINEQNNYPSTNNNCIENNNFLLLKNLYNQSDVQQNINIIDNQSYKTNSNDIDN